MSNVLDKMRTKAEALGALRARITEMDEAHRAATDPLKRERDELNASLLEDLKKYDLKTVKSGSGESFTRAVRKSVGIMDPRLALTWATEHGAISIDKVRAGAMLKAAKELPAGFEFVEVEYMSIRAPKKEGDTNAEEAAA